MILKKIFAAAAMAGAAFGTALGAAPAQAGGFFPTAQDYLAAQGYDPAIANEVAGDNVRIRVLSPEGLEEMRRAVSVVDDASMDHLYAGALAKIDEADTKAPLAVSSLTNVFAGRESLPTSLLRAEDADCFVMGVAKNVELKDLFSASSQIPQDVIGDIGMTDEEFRLFILVHEMRHCYRGPGSDGTQFVKDYESDWYGAKIIARVFNRPELIDTIMKMRAGNIGQYMTSLYIDQMRKGETPVSLKEANEAGMAVRIMADRWTRAGDENHPYWMPQYRKIREVLEKQGNSLPPLQKRWAELFIGAYDQFAPGVREAQDLVGLYP